MSVSRRARLPEWALSSGLTTGAWVRSRRTPRAARRDRELFIQRDEARATRIPGEIALGELASAFAHLDENGRVLGGPRQSSRKGRVVRLDDDSGTRLRHAPCERNAGRDDDRYAGRERFGDSEPEVFVCRR